MSRRVGPTSAPGMAARAVRGFALVPAIFLMVVLASLAAFAIRLNLAEQQTVDLALLGARGLAAANTGIEWGAYRALNGTCSGGTLTLTEGALAGFTVAVTCTSAATAEGAGTVSAYTVEAVATTGTYGQPGYVRRRIRTTLAQGS